MKTVKISGLIKDGNVDVGYYGDDFIQNRVTVIATFATALGKHKTWMKFPLLMVDNMAEVEMKNLMLSHLNKFIQQDLFGRAFNMVKRLRRCPARTLERIALHYGYQNVYLIPKQ